MVLVLCLASCATGVEVTRLGDVVYPPSAVVDVLTEPPEEEGLEVIARLRLEVAYYDEAAVLDQLEAAAREVGADAVVLDDVDVRRTKVVYLPPEPGGTASRTGPEVERVVVTARAVRYPDH